MKNILITGNEGYIGTNLTKYLYKDYNINCIDKTTGIPAEHLSKYSVRGNIDCIVHLAALSGIQACEDDLVMAVKDNLSSAFNIFNVAYTENIPVIFLSSQAAKEPKSSTYAMMKHIIEIQSKLSNINNIVLRLTNVYGGEGYLEKKNTVVKKFIESYKNGNPIVIDGDGSQTRDFIHVDDVCKVIELCIRKDVVVQEPLDIGTGLQTSIKELAEMFNYDKIEYDTSSRSVGVETNFADTTRAFELLGFRGKGHKLQKYINERIKDNV